MQPSNQSDSPFHSGEQEMQTRLGVREKIERFAKHVIRDFMPEQHRTFYNQLPFVFVGHADSEGWPWASILFNHPGFIRSDHPKKLRIQASPITGDPLKASLKEGSHIGLLGIELATRRRNRLSGHVTQTDESHIELAVDQAFGNCPQYIQAREHVLLDHGSLPTPVITDITELDEQAVKTIQQSDTFFVASYVNDGSNQPSEGVDVSHRGGMPGFIRVNEDSTITIPDYAGNLHYNTLGNFLVNPKAGLLFLDFERGHILTLTGTVEILWDSPDTEFFEGAERLWNFKLDHGRWIKNALPIRWKFNEYSPNSRLTGTWEKAEKTQQAEAQRNQWLPYEITKIVDESSVIRSFYLKPKNDQRPQFQAGQFLTVKANVKGEELIRTYTVSNSPGDGDFRISVKKEINKENPQQNGVFSNHLHNAISVGDIIEAKAPTGSFVFDASIKRPAVLISAGVGITPMVSMARHALIEGVRTRYIRPVTLISAARDNKQRTFFEELAQLSESSGGKIRSFWSLSKLDDELTPGKDFHHKGRISKEFLQAILPIDNYDFFLCGPNEFMQDMYNILRELSACDARIYAEAFGPASLVRDADKATNTFEPAPIAEEAVVTFTDAQGNTQTEQAWTEEDGNLLEFAEAHGLTPEFGCRSGQCGACKAKLVSGKVSYPQEPDAEVSDNEVLLCCSMPAVEEDGKMSKLEIKLQ